MRSVSQAVHISNKEFLQNVMGEYWQAAHVTGFAEDPAQLDTLGLRHYWGGGIYAKVLPENPGYNNFFVISTFWPDPEDGKQKRRKANFAACYCIMIDDVGRGPGAKIDPFLMGSFERNILPSWELETSPDNFQYGYILDAPEQDAAKVNALLDGLVALGLVEDGTDPGMKGVTRYARLPLGSNTKEKYGGIFRCNLTAWNPDRKYSIKQIADDFGIDLKDFYHDYTISDPVPEESDIVLHSLRKLGLVKEKLREGIYDIICPWLEDHSDRADSGAAYLSPMGFKCHHGHCASRTGKDLLNWLHGKDPEYDAACSAQLPFEPVDTTGESERAKGFYQSQIEQAEFQEQGFEDQIRAAIQAIDPNNPDSMKPAFELLAYNYINLSPTDKEHWLRLIKEEAQITVKTAREQLKHTRSEMLKANRHGKGVLQEPAWKEYNDDKLVACLANFKAMCDFHGIGFAYNEMSHSIDVDIPNVSLSPEDIDNQNLSYLRDLVAHYGIPYMRVGEWMSMAAHERAYHPFRDYLDAQKFRRLDPMFPCFDKVMETLGFDEHEDESILFVRRWLISIVAAVRGHGGAGMKGVLTFTGKQGIGKTSWFRNLVPAGMFVEGVVLDVHNKDTIIKATNYLVCELGELDATFKRDIPALKAFISNREDEVRHPYAAKTSKAPRRTVFCASVNQARFLVDQTGNSRFWPVSVNRCDFKALARMQETGEIDSFWHEIDEMYAAYCDGRQEFRWWIDDDDSEALSSVSESYYKYSPGEVLLREYFDMDGPRTHWMSITEIMDAMALRPKDPHYTKFRDEVLSSLVRITGKKAQRRMIDGVREYGHMMPQHKVEKMKPALAVVEPPKVASTQPFKPSIDDLL